jgi:esterase/lipase superfamily enzyme
MGTSPQRLRLQWQGEPASMNREYLKRYSQELQRDMEILSFGHAGMPVIVFPTSMGRFHDYEDQGMIATLAPKIDLGELQVFCADSVDGESWYNKSVHPRQRVLRHLQYERYLLHELLPLIRSKNASPQLALTGCSFGGYHTMNFALKHPDLVTYCVSMGGAFDIHQFLDGYYDSDCYFNCPPDFLANLTDEWYLSRYRRLNMVLATGEQDICKDENLRLSGILHSRAVPHFLDVWGNNTGHDWRWWRQMAVKFFL